MIKEENHHRLSQICSQGIFSSGVKNEFETAVVKQPSVFEPPKFYCTLTNMFDYYYCIKSMKYWLKYAKICHHILSPSDSQFLNEIFINVTGEGKNRDPIGSRPQGF